MKAWRRIFPFLLIVLPLFAASYSQDNLYSVKGVTDRDTLLLTDA